MSIPGLEKNIGLLLEKSAARYGEKKAIYFDHEDLGFSYRQLNERVNQFANAFSNEGINRGDHVAVMLPNCPEFPVTWLALAKLGAVMVPLNVRYKPVDLEYVLNDSDANTLVIHSEFAQTLLDVWPRILKIDLILHFRNLLMKEIPYRSTYCCFSKFGAEIMYFLTLCLFIFFPVIWMFFSKK